MIKTKLGISVGLFGAALYFMGLISILPMVAMAGYVLLFEENEWLKKTAVKAVAVVVFFAVVSSAIGLLSDTSSFLYDLVYLFKGNINLTSLNRVVSLLGTVLTFAETVFLLAFGFKAFKQGSFKLGPVDNTIDKNM